MCKMDYPVDVERAVAVLSLATLLMDFDIEVSHAGFQAPVGEMQEIS